ncbi:structural maintenance of chromosomes flexible hinge domain-containing protein 1 isoform X2 [Myripristis murdjan]|uniref:structural maintenance of chromosomes flexible hinge domain-containing protein 1 isoform X2 n=1 Tax=Myripristis murdjan TaxID=586833 RepID=UPI0011761714|nr:structural maintenance of chromosomes flexible hinge domain-containing protein 1 isoform X2 [Myripristis murdjan]
MPKKSEVHQLSASFSEEAKKLRRIVVFDCRFENLETVEKRLDTSGLDYNDFLRLVSKKFAIPPNETFVVTTTDRMVLEFDSFAKLQDGSTIVLLQKENQVLPVATEERIVFLPHYDTMVRSGMYEYYASEGQNSLPYALAELVDNSLTATARIKGVRTIEIRMLFDETLGKPAVIVLDNGCGMTSKQLNNWAVYRLSKFTRENSSFASDREAYVRPDPVPRSLNSDISYFGVGGKQAVFYMGETTRMISKPENSPDVHELILSKEEFERKEKNKEDIYSGFIRNRKPGDFSHVTQEDERFLRELIDEEPGKESFTAVVITGIRPEHITFLKQDFDLWTRKLAHVYHYYIHGVNGNDMRPCYENSDNLPNIDIQIFLREKPPRCPRAINLREIDNDMQTLYINATADTFEFKACTKSHSTVEGVLRYHPFLYDRETYPKETDPAQASVEDDDEKESGVQDQARGKRPIFDCYWNGRLIPYTTVSEFDWCARPKRGAPVAPECYSRFSGVLFTDDRFKVTTNKLTFMDLELQLKNKDTIFTRVVNGQEQRVKIQREFTQWLKTCHEKLDKQVQFLGFNEIITRTDGVPKRMQYPWSTFSSIEWDGKTFKTGQYEPKELYDMTRTIPISKIDRTTTTAAIKRSIHDELAKLPDKLNLGWPESNAWSQNAVRPAGTPLGPITVDILNKKGELISKLPSANQGNVKKLTVELKLLWHGPTGNQEIISCVAQHAAKWHYWFKPIASLNKLGKYTLSLNALVNESHSFGGKQLPSYKLHFTITEGNATTFVVGAVSSPLHVGVPFDIPLELRDAHDHPAQPPPDLKPVLECSGLNVSYRGTNTTRTTLTIKDVKALGKVKNYHSKTHDLKVVLPGLTPDSQIVKISLLPGNPHSLHVTPDHSPVKVENGNSFSFNVEVHDEAGNITAQPKLVVRCQVQDLPVVVADCSRTGAGPLAIKPINLKNMNGNECILRVKFDMPGQKHIAAVLRELKVVPSTRVSRIEVYTQTDDCLVLKDKDKIEWEAGDLISNLYYKLLDEGGKEVPLTAKIASMIKVNWTADGSVADLVQGKLPDVQVPKQVQGEHFYQVSFQDQHVSVNTSFTIVPRPDEPKHLKVTPSQSTVRMGEFLPGQITLALTDQYGNLTKTLTPTCVDNVTVEAEGLDKSAVAVTWQESSCSVVVTGVRFKSGTLGIRELCFTCRGFVAQVSIKVTAGLPAQLTLVSGPEQPLQVLNEHGIPTPFIIQLCDQFGNPSPDQRVVVALKSSSKALRVETTVTSQPVDQEGKASFTVSSVSGPKGNYELEFRGSFNKKPIRGPMVKLIVIPDPNKPVSLTVKYDTNAKLPAGGILPVFSVTVVSDEGSPIRGFNPGAALMWLWKGVATGKEPPQEEVTRLMCSKPKKNEEDDCLHFRDKSIPDHAGKYTIQFALNLGQRNILLSEQYEINVVANEPFKLAPDIQPQTPAVSNTDDIAHRTLVKNMTLTITDTYGNAAGLELQGKVVVSIRNPNGGSNQDLPQFQDNTSTLILSLEEGKVHIDRLAVMQNSPGHDGGVYVLHFKPEVPKYPTLAPFELSFGFYNDAENQQNMSKLSKKKDELSHAIAVYKEIFNTNKELLDLLTSRHQDASNKEGILKTELGKRNIRVTQLTSITDIDKVLNEKTAEMDRLRNAPRRVCTIADPFRGHHDVLGKVGHLALVEDDAAAVVISWHIRGDMDCVITRTTDAARRIYNDTSGKQQVMPLETIYRNQSNRPMPHMRNGRCLFAPVGNPVRARDLLIYPENAECCDIVFRTILGDTILMDNLDSANNYRKAVVQQNIPCPTILTRQGERISAMGKFGGAQNRAPSIERLQGLVFGAPPPQQYHTLSEQIAMLHQYRAALQNKNLTRKERDNHMKKLKAPDMVQKEVDMEENLKQLEEINRQLASTSLMRQMKRGIEDAGAPSHISSKRPRRSRDPSHLSI